MHVDEIEEKIEKLEEEVETLKSIVSLFVSNVEDFKRYLKMLEEFKAYCESYRGLASAVVQFEDIVGNDVYVWSYLSKELDETKATINKHIREIESKYRLKLGEKAAKKLKTKSGKLAHHMLNAIRAAIIKQIEIPLGLT